MPYIHVNADELIRKITKLSQLRELAQSVKAAAVHVKGKIATYPEGNQHRAQPFKTDKSRRFFFWALKAGKIEVPYRRGMSPGSQALGRKWTIRGSNSGLTQTIGNNVSYGPLVQGTNQAGYHRTTGWQTTDDVIEQERDTVVSFLLKTLQRIIGG